MILEKSIITKDNEALIQERISAYFSKLGYTLNKRSDASLIFQRGSSTGTWLAFSPIMWKVETLVEFKRESPNSLGVSVIYIVSTAGQLITDSERKFWKTELAGAEKALMTGDIRCGECFKLANDAINQNLLSYLILGLITVFCGIFGMYVFKSLAAAFSIILIGVAIWLIINKYWQKRRITK
jgi:hypothetical protein